MLLTQQIAVVLILWVSFELPFRLAFMPELFDTSSWNILDNAIGETGPSVCHLKTAQTRSS